MNTKKMVTLAMLCAAAFIMVSLIRIPIMPAVPFLKYEPKDVIIVIGGFIYGPVSALIVSAVVSFIEFITISDTGVIGLVMNIISSCGFACVASGVYKLNRTMKGAIIGLVTGVITMVILMLLWNYLITPLYMKISRDVIVTMLLPAFLPFNLLKGLLNMSFTLLLYKPIITALRKTGVVSQGSSAGKNKAALIAGIVFLAVSLIALYFVMK